MKRIIPLITLVLTSPAFGQALPGTELLIEKGDFARIMLDGIDRYLDRAIAASAKDRDARAANDFSSAEAYEKSLQPKRERLRKILGVVDQRLPPTGFEIVATVDQPGPLASTDRFKAYAVRWPVLPGVTGEGLLLEPTQRVRANVVAVPDADMSPEQFAGLAGKLPSTRQVARWLAENGCRVVVPVLINRDDTHSGNPKIGRMTNQTHREFVTRMAYEMGRHLIGFEVQRLLAAVDNFAARDKDLTIGMFGYGEGGLLALYASALDPRITSTTVSGYFGPREKVHDEPYYRGVWSQLKEFGDAELARMIVPRHLVIEQAELSARAAPAAVKGRAGAAPGHPISPTLKNATLEFQRAISVLPPRDKFERKAIHPPVEPGGDADGFRGLGSTRRLHLEGLLGAKVETRELASLEPAKIPRNDSRHERQFDELVHYTQKLLAAAPPQRKLSFWDRVDLKTVEAYKKSIEPLRARFWNEIVGKLPEPTKSPRPRTRLLFETPKFKGYEVLLDVYEDVISYGVLLVPNNLKPGERRPAIVAQHGLEGRPMDVVNPKEKTRFYNSFGTQLAERGYIVFAPQAPYIFDTQFRQVIRKMHSLGLTQYAFIVRQHQVILEFLKTLPFVDDDCIAYYGLSYGGKVAMRIPAILLGYAASICSGDFNEWIWKNITLDWGSSYMFTREYDMYEFNLANTFNYAEMAALIAPRPFMVERGHDDGVGLDEFVAFEFAKVRRHYSRLRIPERTEIEFFAGGHEIHGQGTFAFLQRHLGYPK